MARLAPVASPIGRLLVLLILIAPARGIITSRRMLQTPQLSPLGATKGTARNAGDDDRVNMVKNDHNNEVHGDRSGLGERKDLLPFPNWPFAPPIPAYLLPPPIPQLPFAPPFQIPPIPSVPSWPQFPFPPLQMPPFPFVNPSPPA